MQHVSLRGPVDLQFISTVIQPLGDEAPNERLTQEFRTDSQFMEMLEAYRQSGGLARAQEVFALFKTRSAAEPSVLARWIVKRNVISVDWQSKVWIPLFQFNREDMTLQTGIVEVLMALNPVFESWELAYWFAQPNRWLEDGGKPADLIRTDAHAVLRAACSDRFIAH